MSCVLNLLRRIPARLRANDPEPESYETKVRVLSITCMCILTSASIFGGIWLIFYTNPSSPPAGYYILQAGMLCWAVTSWIVLGWSLYLGLTIPEMMDAILGGCILASFLAVLGSPAFDARYAAMNLFTAVALVVGATWWRLWITLCVILGFINSYDRVAFHAGWHPAAIEPFGEEYMDTLTYAVSTAGYFLGCLIHCATLLLQHAEHVRAKAAAVAAEEVTVTIAGKLQIYDTAAAAEALKHEAAAGVDKELKAAFTALVANLESYRPYLPNWLLTTTDDEDYDADLSTSTKNSEFGVSRGTPAAPTIASLRSVDSILTGNNEQMNESASSSGEKWIRRGGGAASDHSSMHSGANTAKRSDAKRDYAPARTAALEKRCFLKGTVTFAVIEYVTEDVPDSSLSETLTAVADLVHQCASECKGAVHTMLLGEIVVSWNVATRVAGSEAKAARFLLSLQAALADDDNVHDGFTAVAAVSSHQARSETIGTSKKLLTSERSGPLRFKLRGILRYAWTARATAHRNGDELPQKLSVVLLDERTTREASSNFIISSGSVLDLTAYMPTSDMPHISSKRNVGAVPNQTGPATVAPRQNISPVRKSSTAARSNIRRSSSIGQKQQDSTTQPMQLASPYVESDTAKSAEKLPGQPGSPPHAALGCADSAGSPQLVTLLGRSSAADPEPNWLRTFEQEVVHVFDLVSARTGGDDEWLYAMEEGAADAARAAQLMVGTGLRRQSDGVDAVVVREAFEKAGKQRDGAAIMARPLVRQLIEGMHLLPVHV